jgi:hypothetical protein
VRDAGGEKRRETREEGMRDPQRRRDEGLRRS